MFHEEDSITLEDDCIVWMVLNGDPKIYPSLVTGQNETQYAVVTPYTDEGMCNIFLKRECHFYASLEDAKYHVSDWLETISRTSELRWGDPRKECMIRLMQEIRRQRKVGVTKKFLKMRDELKSRIIDVKVERYRNPYDGGQLGYKFFKPKGYGPYGISFKACKTSEFFL